MVTKDKNENKIKKVSIKKFYLYHFLHQFFSILHLGNHLY